jgi:hypothetical protein
VNQRALNHSIPRNLWVGCVLALGLCCFLGAAACGGGSGAGQGQNPPPPTFTTIDAPGAGTASLEGTIALRINASGQVAGYFIDSNGAAHGFIRNSDGSITTFDPPGAGTTQNLGTVAEGINVSGQISGYFLDSADFEHSFVRAAGGPATPFDPAGSSGADSINDAGTVAGGYVDMNGAHGYLRAPNGTFTTFDPTGNPSQLTNVFPDRINAAGAVGGTYHDLNNVLHGFFRDAMGNMTTLDAPGAGTASGTGTEIADINNSGTVVGGINIGVVSGVGVTHSLIRVTDGTYTVFDPPQASGVSSLAQGINDSGAVVGTYRGTDLVRHAYLRQPDGTFVSFDDPNAAQLPLTDANISTAPSGINATGTVVGYYSDSAGVRHGFIWQ